MPRQRSVGYSLAVRPGLVVCGWAYRRIAVPARSNVVFLRHSRDGCVSAGRFGVRDRRQLGLAQCVPLADRCIRVRVTRVGVVLRAGYSAIRQSR
jgi:hypothetical protein